MVPILPFLLQDRLSIPDNHIQAYTSSLLVAYAAPSLIFAIPIGWITDKIGTRQRPFLAGLLLQLFATTALAFGQSISVLIIARLVQGIAAPVVWTTGLAMVQDTTSPRKIGQVLGLIFAVISVGEVTAPVVGGVLYEKLGSLEFSELQ
ncbi:MFS general substrate transporter [Glarea lozoyensis ATCC 20868]|uniref:MFS general substrate transporter n=1 Tax=Glarea lozoyensis (strain ATCC 20868 / MF5171) TaxID=1116229 RepID=S3DMY0_GLAL2|nr:MFS general substrate transporter [Glarea lozoyensis ATCC 20868]EPE27843.1 MFS general substrate transporter [Glarea lozoyensis ATCC 20868]